MTDQSGGGAASNQRYFLYIPVWATGDAPDGGGSETPSSGSESFSTPSTPTDTQSTEPSPESSSSVSTESVSSESVSSESTEDPTPSSSSESSGSPSESTETPTETTETPTESTETPTETTDQTSDSPSGGTSGSGGSSGGDSSGGGGGSSGGGGGSSGGGGGSSGGGGGSSGGSGGSSGSESCFLGGTLIRMADGSLKPIEDIGVGDTVMSIDIPELSRDVHDVETSGHPEYQWCSNGVMDETKIVPGYVASTKPGTHDGFYVINHRIKTTFEHPFLIRRDDQYHFTSAELLRVGDVMMKPGHEEEVIESISQQNGQVHTYNFEVAHFNTYCAEGVWVHNTSGTFGGGASQQTEYSASTEFSPPNFGSGLTAYSSTSASSSKSGSGSKSSGSGSDSSGGITLSNVSSGSEDTGPTTPNGTFTQDTIFSGV